MSCDHCSNTFESLDEIRAHYQTEHNISRGYIKCVESGRKMFYRCAVMQHIERHLNPDKFKYVHCSCLCTYFVQMQLIKKIMSNSFFQVCGMWSIISVHIWFTISYSKASRYCDRPNEKIPMWYLSKEITFTK